MNLAQSLPAFCVMGLLLAVPLPAGAVTTPACGGIADGLRGSCVISCQAFSTAGTLVRLVGDGYSGAPDAALVGLSGCGAQIECPATYLNDPGPVAMGCSVVVSYASTGSLTCYAEQFLGAFACVGEPDA